MTGAWLVFLGVALGAGLLYSWPAVRDRARAWQRRRRMRAGLGLVATISELRADPARLAALRGRITMVGEVPLRLEG